MIDITVDNNEVYVEYQVYHSFNDTTNLTNMITDIINKAKYSGESITLWKAEGKKKRLLEQW